MQSHESARPTMAQTLGILENFDLPLARLVSPSCALLALAATRPCLEARTCSTGFG